MRPHALNLAKMDSGLSQRLKEANNEKTETLKQREPEAHFNTAVRK